MHCTIVADDIANPTEGMNVVTRTLIDDLRAKGHSVRVVPPARLLRRLAGMILRPGRVTVFTHGPGPGTVLASRLLRALSRTRIVWVATRPDLAACPRWLKGGRSAHAVIGNRARADVAAVARGAQIIEQPIGIAPERVVASAAPPLWADLRRNAVPIAVHVGHLRRNRGLEQMIAIKAALGARIELVVLASPHFDPAPGLVEELTAAGVHVRRGFVAAIADVYRSADLYLFPAPPDQEGAIELPLSVLEAMACQTPVIATPFGVLPKVLAGQPGVSFAPPSGFAAAVAAWVDAAPDSRIRPAGLPDHMNAHRLADRVEDQMKV